MLNVDCFPGRNSISIKIDPIKFINESLRLYPNGIIMCWTTNNSTNFNLRISTKHITF